MTNSFLYTVNKSIRNKAQSDQMHLLTTRYKNKKGSLEDIKKDIKEGFALASAQTDGLSRCDAHFKRSQTIFIDIDNGWSINEAVSAEIVQNYFRLIYTTPSHTEENHRFRILGILPVVIDDKLVYKKTVEIALEKFKAADTSCKDACRAFYGSTTAIFPFQNDDNYIPIEWVDEAHERAIAERELESLRLIEAEKRRQQFEALSEEEKNALYSEIEKALMYIPGRRPGTGTYKETMGVLRALLNHYGEHQAIQIAERWNPSTPDFNVAQKIRSFRGKADKVSIGTIFHYAYQNGYQFPNRNPFKTREEFIKTLVIPVANPKELIESETLALTISQSIEGYKSIKVDTDKLKGFTYATYIKVLKKDIKKTKASQLLIVGLWSEAELLNTLISIAQSLRIDFSLLIENQIIGVEDFRIEVSRRQKVERIKAECDRLSALTHQPTQKINERFLPKFTELSKTKQLIAVSSATGSGKTERVKDLMKLTLAMNPERQVYNLSYRNALSTDTAQRLGLAHLHTVGKDFFKYKNKSCCVDSIHKLALDEIGYADLLVIDEVEAFINHLVNGSTCKARRGEILRQFISFVQMIIRKGGFVVIMEADLSDVSIDFFRAIIGESVGMELIVNEYETIKYPVTFVQSKKSDCLVDLMTETLEAGEKFLFVSNSQKECERVHKILAKCFDVAMYRIDGKTSETEEAKAILANLNVQIEDKDLWVLILSPSLESGGNITTKRFAKVFAAFVNTDVRRAVQMLNRLRTDVPRYVHIRDNKQISLDSHTLNVNALKASLLSNEQETARVCKINRQANVKDLVFDLAKLEGSNWIQSAPIVAKADSSSELGFVLNTAIKLQVRSNCSMVNLEQNLMDRFERLAFDVSIVEMDASDAVKQAVKEVKKEIKEADIEERYLAGSWMDEATALEVKNNPQSVREDRITADQSLLNLRYNGEIELDRDKLNFVYVKDDGKTINKLRFLVRCQNVEKSLIKERKYQEKFADALLTDKRHDHIKVKFIAEVFPMLLQLIDSSEMFNGESEVSQHILRLAKQHRIEIKQYFGLNITDETTANQCISKLAKTLFGLKLQSKRIGGRKDQAYFYWFDLPSDEIYYDFWQAETKLIRKEHYSAKPTKRIESIEYQKPEPVIEQLNLAVAS